MIICKNNCLNLIIRTAILFNYIKLVQYCVTVGNTKESLVGLEFISLSNDNFVYTKVFFYSRN